MLAASSSRGGYRKRVGTGRSAGYCGGLYRHQNRWLAPPQPAASKTHAASARRAARANFSRGNTLKPRSMIAAARAYSQSQIRGGLNRRRMEVGTRRRALDTQRIAALRAQAIGWKKIAAEIGVGVGTIYRTALMVSKLGRVIEPQRLGSSDQADSSRTPRGNETNCHSRQ